jgi:hypothetical protein
VAPSIHNHTSLLTLLRRPAAIKQCLRGSHGSHPGERDHRAEPTRTSLSSMAHTRAFTHTPLASVAITRVSHARTTRRVHRPHVASAANTSARKLVSAPSQRSEVPPHEQHPFSPASHVQRVCPASHLRHHRRECVPYTPQQLTQGVQSSSRSGVMEIWMSLAQSVLDALCGAAASTACGGLPSNAVVYFRQWKGVNRCKQRMLAQYVAGGCRYCRFGG